MRTSTDIETEESYLYHLFHKILLPYRKWLHKDLLEDINKMNISILSSIGKLNYSNQREKLIIRGTRALQYYFTGYRTFDTDTFLLSGNFEYVNECVEYIKNQLAHVEYTTGLNFEFIDSLNNDKNTRKITLKYPSYKNDGQFLYLNLFDCFFKENKSEAYFKHLEMKKNEKFQLLFYIPTIDNIQKHLQSEINDLRSKINLLHNENQIEKIIRGIENLQQLRLDNDNEFKDRANYYINKFNDRLNEIGKSKNYRNEFLQRERKRAIKKRNQQQEHMNKLDEALQQARLKTQEQKRIEHMNKLDQALQQARLNTQEQKRIEHMNTQEQKRIEHMNKLDQALQQARLNTQEQKRIEHMNKLDEAL